MDGARNPTTPYVAPKAPAAPKAPGGAPKTKATDASKLSALLGMFPSTTISSKELRGVRQTSRQQVLKDYAATPLPSMQSYLQPFADASARVAANGQNYYNYLSGATDYAKGLSGAFGDTLTGSIAAGQQAGQAMGGSGAGVADPAASTIPLAAVGSNFVNYLNALKPVAGASVQESQRLLNGEEAKAQGTYEQAAGTRRQDMQTAIDKLYGENVNSLQNQRNSDLKGALSQYALTGTTQYRADQLKLERQRLNQQGANADRSAGLADRRLNLEQRRVNAEVKKWSDASAAKGIKIPGSVLKMLQGSSHYKTASNDYQVQKVLLTPDAAGHPAGTLYGNPSYVPRGPRQGAPQTDAQGFLIDASGKRTGYKLISHTPRVTQGKDKVYVPLTGAQWDAAAQALGLSTGKGLPWAKSYLTSYMPRPQGS